MNNKIQLKENLIPVSFLTVKSVHLINVSNKGKFDIVYFKLQSNPYAALPTDIVSFKLQTKHLIDVFIKENLYIVCFKSTVQSLCRIAN